MLVEPAHSRSQLVTGEGHHISWTSALANFQDQLMQCMLAH